MSGRKIKEIADSSSGMYIRNIADINLEDYIQKLEFFIDEEDPSFLFMALKEIGHAQEINGSWYNDLTITSYILRALMNMRIGGWNIDSSKEYINKTFLEKGDLYVLSLPQKYMTFLKNGLINEKIKKAFENNNLPITSNSQVLKIDEDEWKLFDGKINYRITLFNNRLNICCDFFWGINPNIWVSLIVLPTLRSLEMVTTQPLRIYCG